MLHLVSLMIRLLSMYENVLGMERVDGRKCSTHTPRVITHRNPSQPGLKVMAALCMTHRMSTPVTMVA